MASSRIPTNQSQRAPGSIPNRTITAQTGLASAAQSAANDVLDFVAVEQNENDTTELTELNSRTAEAERLHLEGMRDMVGRGYSESERKNYEESYTKTIQEINASATNDRVRASHGVTTANSENTFLKASSNHAMTQRDVVRDGVSKNFIDANTKRSVFQAGNGDALGAHKSMVEAGNEQYKYTLRSTGSKEEAHLARATLEDKHAVATVKQLIENDQIKSAQRFIATFDRSRSEFAPVLSAMDSAMKEADLTTEAQDQVTSHLADADAAIAEGAQGTRWSIAAASLAKALDGKTEEASLAKLDRIRARAKKDDLDIADAWYRKQKGDPLSIAKAASKSGDLTASQAALVVQRAKVDMDLEQGTADSRAAAAQVGANAAIEATRDRITGLGTPDLKGAKEWARKNFKGTELNAVIADLDKRLSDRGKELNTVAYKIADAAIKAAKGNVTRAMELAKDTSFASQFINLDQGALASKAKAILNQAQSQAIRQEKIDRGDAYKKALLKSKDSGFIGLTKDDLSLLDATQVRSLQGITPPSATLEQKLFDLRSDYLAGRNTDFLDYELKGDEGHLRPTRLEYWMQSQAHLKDSDGAGLVLERNINKSARRAQQMITDMTSKAVTALPTGSKKRKLNEDVGLLKVHMDGFVRDWYADPKNSGEMPSELYAKEVISQLAEGSTPGVALSFFTVTEEQRRIRATQAGKGDKFSIDFENPSNDRAIAAETGAPVGDVRTIIEVLKKQGVIPSIAEIKHKVDSRNGG
ncbi:hypothetical protein OAF54_00795 [bacterium]|nr:hypothetical protein [bacterium]